MLDRSLDAVEERDFEDGEHKLRPLVSVREEDVYVIHSLHADGKQSVNDKLCKLLFFIATLKDCGAARVTAIIPYLCYARKDRRTKARDPVTIRYVAALFEAVKVDRLVTIDVHNLQAFQNAFRCPTEHMEACDIFVSYFRSRLKDAKVVVVMSPDIGGVKRAEKFRERLSGSMKREVRFAFMEKFRSMDQLSGGTVVGEVAGSAVIILDDLINSGSTMARAAAACRRMGAAQVYGVATHGMFVPKTNEAIGEQALAQIVVTNTVATSSLDQTLSDAKIVSLDVSPMFAEAIRRLHSGGSLVSLLGIE